MELSPPVFTTYGLSRLGFEHRTFRLRGERSNSLRHRRGWLPSLPSHYHSAKRSALGASVTGPRRWPLMFAPCHSRRGTQKNPHCSMATSAEHRSKFVTLHWQWWRLHMSEKFSSGTINPKQKHNLNNLFSLSIKFDEIGNVLPKEKESLTYTMNFSFFYTMSRNNVNSNAYRFYTYFSTLCKYRMPWKSYLDIFYLFLLLSCTSKSLWQFLPHFWRIL